MAKKVKLALPSGVYERLREMAVDLKTTPAAMVAEWIEERLSEHEQRKADQISELERRLSGR